MAPNTVAADDRLAQQAGEPLAGSGRGRVKNKLFGVCMFILAVEMMERLCYYTVYNTYAQYLINAGPAGNHLTQGQAGALKQSFRMLAYTFPLVGGYLADNVFGRYRTIFYFTICYVVGTTLVAIGAQRNLMESHVGMFISLGGALVFTAIGTGAIKPNVVNFGAEQYDENDPEEAEQQLRFFSYFYQVINIGGAIAPVWMAGLATSQVTANSAGDGFFLAYLLAAVSMGLALLIFLAGTGRYSTESKAVPRRKPMVSIVRRHLTEGASRSWRGTVSLVGMALLPCYLIINLMGSVLPIVMPHTKFPTLFASEPARKGMSIFDVLGLTLAVLSSAMIVVAHGNNDWIAPLRDGGGSGITTEEVRGFLRALPTILLISIGFNLAYNGMDIYGIQACQMDVNTYFPPALNDFFFLQGGQFNGQFFSLGDNFAIILGIPVLQGMVLPALKRMRGGVPVTRKTLFTVGFLLAMAACGLGIVIEGIRKKADFIQCSPTEKAENCFCGLHAHTQDFTVLTGVGRSDCLRNSGQWLEVGQCAPKGVPMSKMSAWWTFIPYFITGIGEILCNPVVQEFSFDEVSPNLKSLLMGVTVVVQGCVPSVIEGALFGFMPNDLNLGNADIVFIVFIVLSAISLPTYYMFALPEKAQRDAPQEVASA